MLLTTVYELSVLVFSRPPTPQTTTIMLDCPSVVCLSSVTYGMYYG